MRKIFTQNELKAYIEKISDQFNLNIRVSESPIILEHNHMNFKGTIGRARGEKVIAIPLESFNFGVIRAKSVLYAKRPSDLIWMVNGQALNSKTNEAAFFINDGSVPQLHVNKEVVKNFVYENFNPSSKDEKIIQYLDGNYNYLINTGLYGDETSFGSHVEKENSETLVLQLEPVFKKSLDIDLDGDITLKKAL